MVRRKVVYIFPNLMAEMSRNGDSLQSVSNELGMNYQALSARLRGFKGFEFPLPNGSSTFNCSVSFLER